MRLSAIAFDVHDSLREDRRVMNVLRALTDDCRTALPYDVLVHIAQIVAVQRIQRQARVYSMVHVRHVAWRYLREKLVLIIGSGIDALSRCAQVRREWRQEPDSWILELNTQPETASIIVDEVLMGLWETPRPINS